MYADTVSEQMEEAITETMTITQLITTDKITPMMVYNIGSDKLYSANRIALAYKVKYSNQEVDYFALYCIETKILCLVPFEQAQTNTISIRLDSYQGKRLKTMRFVSEYQFESFINLNS